MSTIVITETCGCGATFDWRGSNPIDSRRAVTEWRSGHKHAEAVGICGDRSRPLVMADGKVDQMWCELGAGHAGAHSDGQGRHWIKAKREDQS